MGIDTFMRMYLVFLKQDLLLFFSWHQIYCSSPLLTEWCEPQACVWHFENSHRTSVKPQTVCWFKAISSWNVTQSCYGKPRTLTYEHTQIPVAHLAKLHTYSCRHVLMYTFFFFLLKDEKYWSRRCKNNEAAKRSRDARRLKENQISVRAAFLERENASLRQEVADMRKELGRCRNILNKYESHHLDQ